MKVLLIGSVPPSYHGATVYFQSLLNSRIRDLYAVHHLDTSDHRSIDNITKLDIINVYLAIKNILQIIRMLRAGKFDIVYVPVAPSALGYLRDGLFIFFANYLSNAKIIIHLHTGNYFRKEFYNRTNGIMRWFVRKTLSYVHTAIVVGERVRDVFDGLVERVEVVPNGIPDMMNGKAGPDSPDRPVIGYMGNFFESKGIFDIIEAASEVIKRYPDVTFRFAGAWFDREAETKEKVFRLIDRYGLRDNVKFEGVLRNGKKDKFFSETSIFILPSRNEGLPLVILEAMAARLPVISTKNVGVIPEVVIDGETGILVDKKSPDQIARALIYLIENPEIRQAMGEAGRKRFENYYTIEKNIERMIGVFEKVYHS